MATPIWASEDKKETSVIINGERWVPEFTLIRIDEANKYFPELEDVKRILSLRSDIKFIEGDVERIYNAIKDLREFITREV